jgi:ribosomal protein S1
MQWFLSSGQREQKDHAGVKQLGENPWENTEKMMPVGHLVKGIVTKINRFRRVCRTR